jgi:Txe/YoeB family toxin of Txe-Axe toxin-antitoxin module
MIEEINKIKILSLYKNLIKKSKNLKYTDQKYFQRRIKEEFLIGKEIKDDSVKEIMYKVIL